MLLKGRSAQGIIIGDREEAEEAAPCQAQNSPAADTDLDDPLLSASTPSSIPDTLLYSWGTFSKGCHRWATSRGPWWPPKDGRWRGVSQLQRPAEGN